MSKLKDVAEKAGVNISTASRALNNDSEINEKTRERISKIAKELGYKKKSRRSTASRQSKNIGVILPEIISDYYSMITDNIHNKLLPFGYECLIGITNFDSDKMLNLLMSYNESNLAGIICVMDECEGNLSDDMLLKMAEIKIPIVFIASDRQKNQEYDMVWVDEHTAVKKAIDYLIEMGHTSIAFIGEEKIEPRMKAYLEHMKQRNLFEDASYCLMGKERFELGGYLRMKELLSLSALPSAVFIGYDQMVVGASKALEEAKISVPDEISIISFDNIAGASYILGGLTTISNPVSEMTDVVTRILISKIQNKGSSIIQNVSLQPIIIERTSVGHHKAKTDPTL